MVAAIGRGRSPRSDPAGASGLFVSSARNECETPPSSGRNPSDPRGV
jgi:hypothetical protein